MLNKDKLREKIRTYQQILQSLEQFDTDCSSSIYRAAGLVVRELRGENKLSQKTLCDMLSLPQATLSQIENGKYNVGLHRYIELCAALNCDITTFVKRAQEKQASGHNS
jgi:DNA-binding XRE family transcriptional regulator